MEAFEEAVVGGVHVEVDLGVDQFLLTNQNQVILIKVDSRPLVRISERYTCIADRRVAAGNTTPVRSE